jgi:hypothetical protein
LFQDHFLLLWDLRHWCVVSGVETGRGKLKWWVRGWHGIGGEWRNNQQSNNHNRWWLQLTVAFTGATNNPSSLNLLVTTKIKRRQLELAPSLQLKREW